MSKNVISVDDLMETVSWVGRPISELGINLEERQMSSKLEGAIFGAAAEGNVYFTGDANEKIVNEISLYSYDINLRQLYDKFNDLYCGVIDFGMEPYVQANHGALEWYVFDAGNALIKISQGSEAKFAEIDFYVNPEPGSPAALVLREGKSVDNEMGLEVRSYDNGILKAAIVNMSDGDLTFDEEFGLYEAKEGEDGSYYSMTRVGNSFMPSLADSVVVPAGETVEMDFDLREFGKVKPNKYRLKYGELDVDFELVEE